MTPEEIKKAQEAAEAARDATLARIKEHEEKTGKLLHDLDEAHKALKAQVETKGIADPELKEKQDRLWARVDEIDAKLSAPLHSTHQLTNQTKSIFDRLDEHPDLVQWRKGSYTSAKGMRFGWDGLQLAGTNRNAAVNPFFPNEPFYPSARKSLISTSALGVLVPTTEVIMPQALPGIIQVQRRELRMRNLLRTQAATTAAVVWMKQNVVTNAASPQAEGEAKAESTITYVPDSTTVTTIAHWLQVTRQALDDFGGLRADIDDTLMYGLKQREDSEILSGDGLGTHLSGLTTQATAYAGTYVAASDTRLDTLRHAILEARLAEFPVDGIVLNPVDVHAIELIKDDVGGANTGRYIVGDPRTGLEVLTIWGRPVVETTAMPSGHFLVGAFAMGAILFDRMTATIDISFQHGTNFTENEATILAEERLALGVIRPAAFRYGSF